MWQIPVFLASVAIFVAAPVKAEPHQVNGVRDGDASSWTGAAAKLSKFMARSYASDPDEKGYQVVDFCKPIAKIGEGEWICYQRNQGTDVAGQQKAYRQRVLQLIDLPDGSVAQRTWSLIEPEKFAGARANPDILKLLALVSLTPTMEQGCDQIWHQNGAAKMKSNPDDQNWSRSVNPKSCTIIPNAVTSGSLSVLKPV
ncbi:MAG: CpcT/CpeT family chromophore lyase [Parasphingorhabdus sp.]